jgi:tRNA (guanine-N7-)-methyltransferase
LIPANRIFLKEKPEIAIGSIYGESPGFIAVEIGFGNGEFLVHTAKAHPEGFIFGVEVSLQCVMKAVKRIQRSECTNARVLQGDARFILGECFFPESLNAVYMNFPCPWPKTRHAKRRVTFSGFTDALAGALVVGGFFEIVTDDMEYADEVSEVIPSHHALELFERSPVPEREISTKYERKWREQGKSIHLLRFEKTVPFMPDKARKEDIQLHSALSTPCPGIRCLELLADQEGGVSTSRWVFKESFVSSAGVMLVEVITSDEGFRQTFFIRVIPRREGCLVKMDATTRPFRTPAVSGAFAFLVAYLEENSI